MLFNILSDGLRKYVRPRLDAGTGHALHSAEQRWFGSFVELFEIEKDRCICNRADRDG